jgi:hypothetical protein
VYSGNPATDPALTHALSESITVTGSLARAAGENVGAYLINLGTLASVSTNYTLVLSATPVNFTITPKPASVTPNGAGKQYGASDPPLTGTLTGFLPGDGVTATYTRVAGNTVAGSPYTISASLAPAGVLGNYDIAYNTAAFIITPKPLTITANSRAKLLGDIVTFTGTEFTTSSLVSGDSVTSVTLNSAGAPAAAPVGTYPIVASSAVGAGLSNYGITYIDGVLTVGYKICVLYNEALAHKKGSTIPIKLNLCDAAGNNVSSSAVVVKATQIVRLDAVASPFVAEDSGNANPDLDFRYAGGSYIFNLSTKSSGFVQGSWGINFTVDGAAGSNYGVKFDIK